MSRMRIMAKVRKNPDYQALTRYLEDLDLPFELCKPEGKGHPYLMIFGDGGQTLKHLISCTPGPRACSAARVSELRRRLEAAGLTRTKR